MSHDPKDADTETLNSDDAPTERINLDQVPKPDTNPTQAGVLDPSIAASIRAEHAQTVSEDDNITFVGVVDDAGRILLPESIRESGAVRPGDELLVRAVKIT